MNSADNPVIADGKVVAFYFTLKDDAGAVLDTNRKGGKPLTYLHGTRQIVVGLEKALAGKQKNDFVHATIAPEEAFGVRNEALVERVQRSAMPTNVPLRVGMLLSGADQQGRPVNALVTSIEGDVVTVDRNHPLAGKTLHYEILVVGVRDAKSDEVAHGHVHGPGGVDH